MPPKKQLEVLKLSELEKEDYLITEVTKTTYQTKLKEFITVLKSTEPDLKPCDRLKLARQMYRDWKEKSI
jgi:hypothetical protein